MSMIEIEAVRGGVTTAQRDAALEKANRTRSYRARLKDDIRAGLVDWREIIRCPPEMARTMLLVDVLMAARRVGPQGTDAALLRADVGTTRRLNQLTPRQITAICEGRKLNRGANQVLSMLREENAKLKADNDRLTREVEVITAQPWHMELVRLRREVKALRRENLELGAQVAA